MFPTCVYFPATGAYLQMAAGASAGTGKDAARVSTCGLALQNIDVEGYCSFGGAEGIRTLDLLDAIERECLVLV